MIKQTMQAWLYKKLGKTRNRGICSWCGWENVDNYEYRRNSKIIQIFVSDEILGIRIMNCSGSIGNTSYVFEIVDPQSIPDFERALNVAAKHNI